MRTAYLGNWDKGCEMAQRAMKLNTRHPGWYWFPQALRAFRQHDFSGALSFNVKVNMPLLTHTLATFTAIYGHMGNHKEARQSLKELLALKPDFAAVGRRTFEKYFSERELVDLFEEGWRKAGLYHPSPLARQVLTMLP
jgi:tetratricopeptide (TPR) repeat protein